MKHKLLKHSYPAAALLLSFSCIVIGYYGAAPGRYILYDYVNDGIVFLGPFPMLGGCIEMVVSSLETWRDDGIWSHVLTLCWFILNALLWLYGMIWIYFPNRRNRLIFMGYYVVTIVVNIMNTLMFTTL